jgi:hypothetical protein
MDSAAALELTENLDLNIRNHGYYIGKAHGWFGTKVFRFKAASLDNIG